MTTESTAKVSDNTKLSEKTYQLPVRTNSILPHKEPAAPNPFTAIEDASRTNAELLKRLQDFAKRMVGDVPPFNLHEKEVEGAGLLPFTAKIATLMAERDRYMISLIDRMEEHML